MFCRKCGKELRDGENVCPQCGEPVSGASRQIHTHTATYPPAGNNVSTKKVMGTIAIISLLIIAVLGATVFFMNMEHDYRVTLTFKEVAVYSEDGYAITPTVYDAATDTMYYIYTDSDGVTHHTEPLKSLTAHFSTEYNGETRTTHDINLDIIRGITHSDDNYVEYGRSVTFDVTSSGDGMYISIFMLMDDTGDGSTIDIFTEENGNKSVSGVSCYIELTEERDEVILIGDSSFFGAVKISVDVDRF